MSKQNLVAETQSDEQRLQKRHSDDRLRQLGESGTTNEFLPGFGASIENNLSEHQSSVLNDIRFQDVQRQAMATRTGQIGGNLYLQRALGASQHQASAKTTKPSTTIKEATTEPVVQRGLWDSLTRGAEMYVGMDDEGASFARDLMEWRILGFGMDFIKIDSAWSNFMVERPEIQRAMAPKFEELVEGFAAAGPGSGNFSDSITDVQLNELESMRLTLHGCHRIDINGEYEVTEEGTDRIVRLSNVTFTWIDRADLHPGTETELESGEAVDDQEFTGAGWDYDIQIYFFMPSVSTWRVSGGATTHERGWPPVTGAPAAGFRG